MKFFFQLICSLAIVSLLNSCSKGSGDTITPTPTSTAAVAANSATVSNLTTITTGVTISGAAASSILSYGVVWGTSSNPDQGGTGTLISTPGGAAGTFNVVFNAPSPSQLYYIKPFIQLSSGVYTYGNQLTATTDAGINNASVTDIKTKSALFTATTISTPNYGVSARGFCYNTSPNPTVSNTIVSGGTTGFGTFSASSLVLTPNTVYYVRPYFGYGSGMFSYGTEFSIRTTGYPSPSGGYVLYDKGQVSNGWRYMEADPTNLTYNSSTNILWGCSGTSISFTTPEIGSGAANTNYILTGCSTAGIAAKVCNAYSKNGYTGWFLPSTNEGLMMGTEFKNIGISISGGFWTSNEQNSTTAYVIGYNSGTSTFYTLTFPKSTTANVYAMRAY